MSWFLVWFQFVNGTLKHYEIGQFLSEKDCIEAKEKANVLLTNTNEALYCFEVAPK
jgi:hypothetical protein